MLITDRFVYIHEPKTGGTFVKEALYRVHLPGEEQPRPPSHAPELKRDGFLQKGHIFLNKVSRRWRTLLGSDVERRENMSSHTFNTRYGTITFWENEEHGANKHGGRAEIPKEHRNKPIVATVRNPYDLYVSEYMFGWWKKPRYRDQWTYVPEHFPDLTFDEYVRFINAEDVRSSRIAARKIGHFSYRFLSFHSQELYKLANSESLSSYLSGEDYRNDLNDIHFLKTNQLNEQLYSFLLKMGYPERDIRFVRKLDKIKPPTPAEGTPRNTKRTWKTFYSSETKRFVREKEDVLFRLFPEFDV